MPLLFWTVENIANITTVLNPGNVHSVVGTKKWKGMHKLAWPSATTTTKESESLEK